MEYIVTTPCGKLRGTETRVDGIVAYKGIRYATAGRFEYPREVTFWEGIYDATEYGACAYQARAFCDEEQMPKKIFYYSLKFLQIPILYTLMQKLLKKECLVNK